MRPHLPVNLFNAVIASFRRIAKTVASATTIASSVATLSFAISNPSLADDSTIDYSIYSGDIYTYVGTNTQFANGGITKATLDDNGNITDYGNSLATWNPTIMGLFYSEISTGYNTVRFVTPGSTVGSLTVSSTNLNVYCDFPDVRLGGLIVESGATGYTFRGGAGNPAGGNSNARDLYLGYTNQTKAVQFTINEDFNLGTASSYWRTVKLQANWNVQVAQGKSLNFYVETLSVTDGATSALTLGGTTADSTNTGTLNLYYATSATLQTLTFNSGYLGIGTTSGGVGH
jgi:hypothetical protein